ncbi:cupredoxin domain-containing protein [Lentilactobacillus hilgardii]|uniref:cupredoxin domain-containing protein n=2 Tax=Lentilactobacillus hilgardii TaxID=1588 RepID=UPI0021C30E1D|nr:cupredoxin domain-containing protein [Lentilactobacillus hilgardii]MCP9333160.1 cupredoxin domain-containing protein [Lentilactobacillus hilgardii]MCP9349743.1 cupredoxin domain-containing protein [Lentilactobacillus hilgardii]MCP9352671.1 cupredoxin domain-containing protein [Lentilactobacillus hilgardii]
MMNLKKLFGGQNKSETTNSHTQIIKISVDHGYEPSTVTLKQGVPAKLIFYRINESSCLAKVQSEELSFKNNLPLNKNVEVSVSTDKSGEFNYACGMNMFHGKVIVNE